ncbi:uncharacterized protein LOC127862882 [Dreissena polymorpha]|uniref:Uncharacterized protein n=1 Tax=Dreissena polymorpha TaxID=45954 RepID=A0A9D3YGR9_DREPO|nr:uncharacterized protein LOC127862882 [Dreissena polymorpha]XP_052258095.1 uncharacterized protein LOC127862882 [Dreissena polymorpha]KAH3698456.1 hypothetical protein DPMN_085977 [Dreissena polymorpha]
MSKQSSGKTLSELAESVVTIDRGRLLALNSFSADMPDPMFDTMMAALLLLGEENPDWDAIRYSLTRNDGKGLTDLVLDYDPSDVSEATKAKAKELLSKFTLQYVKRVNTVCAIVFEWAVAAADA